MNAHPDLAKATRWPLGLMVVCGFPQHALPHQLQLARRLGASHVECYVRWAAAPDPQMVAEQVSDACLSLWGAHGPWGSECRWGHHIDLGSLDRTERQQSVEEVLYATRWVASSGGARLVVHPGGLSDANQWASRRDALRQSLSDLATPAADHDVTICVENMPPGAFPGSCMEDIARLVRDLDASHIAVCLDTGHAHLREGVIEQVRAACAVIRTTHLHDNNGRRDQHLPPGLGTIRWQDLGASLDKTDYDGPLVLECPRYLRRHPEVISDELRNRLDLICQRPGQESGVGGQGSATTACRVLSEP